MRLIRSYVAGNSADTCSECGGLAVATAYRILTRATLSHTIGTHRNVEYPSTRVPLESLRIDSSGRIYADSRRLHPMTRHHGRTRSSTPHIGLGGTP